MPNPTFAVRIDANTQAAIRKHSLKEGRPLPDVIAEALKEYLERRGAPTQETVALRLKPGRRCRELWPDDEIVVIDEESTEHFNCVG